MKTTTALEHGNDLVASMWAFHKAAAAAEVEFGAVPKVTIIGDRVHVAWIDNQQAWDDLLAAGGEVDGDVVRLDLGEHGRLSASRVPNAHTCERCGGEL